MAVSTRTNGYRLAASDRRLQERVGPFLAAGERIEAALVMSTGATPGIEAVVAPFVAVLGAIGVAIGIAGIQKTRKYFTLVVTDRGVLLLSNRRASRPDRLIHRFDGLGAVGVVDQDGDLSIEVDGKRYWVHGVWAYQLYRLQQLKRSRRPS